MLRSVPTELGAVSLSLNGLFYQFLGSIPGPYAMGVLMDFACDLKNMLLDGCGEGNSCGIFNNAQMWNSLSFMVAVSKGLSLVFTYNIYR